MKQLSHIDSKGSVRMVDVSAKADTKRVARAGAAVFMRKATLEAITKGRVPKGDVFATAKIAGIQAAKRTFELIPMRSEEHTSELQSQSNLVCRLLLEK